MALATKTGVSGDGTGAPGLGPPVPPRGEGAGDGPGRSLGRSRPLKLCFVSPLGYGLYRPESGQPYGGAEVQCYLLARELAREGRTDVVVLTTTDSTPGWERDGRVAVLTRRRRGRLERARGWPPWRLPQAVTGGLAACREMYRLFRSIDADAYLHAGAGVEVGAYGLIARVMRRPFIYLVASSADVSEPYGKVTGMLRWLYPLGLRLATAVVCRTREQQAGLRRRYGLDSTLIRTGHPTDAAPAGERSAVLWVGRLVPLKQPHLFLDVAERLGGVPCVMAVVPDPRHEDLWRSVRARAGRLAHVTLREHVPRREIAELFGRARVLVNTSTYEGFPNTFVEAAMQATPIVSWRVNPDRVLTDQGIGRCADGSADRLLADVRELAAGGEVWAEAARRARAYALAHHDITASARELERLVRSVLPPARAGLVAG